MNERCHDARPLIAPYLDGELSEAQAGPLRKHLLDCPACRTSLQAEKSAKRWFVAAPASRVPAGFAARVARRAFAGDRGLEEEGGLEEGGGLEETSEAPWNEAGLRPVALPRPAAATEPLKRFVTQLTAVAATSLLFVSVGIRSLSLPSGASLSAEPAGPSFEEAREAARARQEAARRLERELERSATSDAGAPAPASDDAQEDGRR